MTSPSLPCLAITGATQILQQGLDTSQSIAQSWDQQWLTIFNTALYVAINQTAAIFATGALIFFFVQFGRQLIVEGDLTRPLQNLIWPIIVVCLLANNAHLLAISTVSLCSVIHTLSDQVLEITLLDVKLRDAVQSATSRSAVASEISAQLSQCEGMVGKKYVLLTLQWAFTNILEISILLTGLMGPFAVAGSLLRFEAKPLFAWLTGFFRHRCPTTSSVGWREWSWSMPMSSKE
ncbi:MAG: hypothetical protein F6J97_23850 [Leptolyngbya sp. SIO4C1]|nr:hypothetical protein [Leptolyngbya sp. SIO4C1]